MKIHQIGNIQFAFVWAPPKTIWYIQSKRKYRHRVDNLFGLNRNFLRKYNEYVYSFYIGRLKIMMRVAT